MTNPTDVINFDKIEKLREHIQISRTSLASLIGVSRVMYWKWLNAYRKGQPIDIGAVNRTHIRDTVTGLVNIVRTTGWPSDAAKSMTEAERLGFLRDQLSKEAVDQLLS